MREVKLMVKTRYRFQKRLVRSKINFGTFVVKSFEDILNKLFGLQLNVDIFFCIFLCKIFISFRNILSHACIPGITISYA